MPKKKRPRVICDDSDEEEFDVHLVSGNSCSILEDSKIRLYNHLLILFSDDDSDDCSSASASESVCSDVASEEEENDSDFDVGWASKKAPKSKKPKTQQKQKQPQQRNRTSKLESVSRKQTSRTANCVTTNSHATFRTLQTSPTLVLTKCDVTSRDDVGDCVTSSRELSAKMADSNIIMELLVLARDGRKSTAQHNCAILIAKLCQTDAR